MAQWYHSYCAGNRMCWTNITDQAGGKNCDEIFSYQKTLLLSKKVVILQEGVACDEILFWGEKINNRTETYWNTLAMPKSSVSKKKKGIRCYFSLQNNNKKYSVPLKKEEEENLSRDCFTEAIGNFQIQHWFWFSIALFGSGLWTMWSGELLRVPIRSCFCISKYTEKFASAGRINPMGLLPIDLLHAL